MILVLVLVN